MTTSIHHPQFSHSLGSKPPCGTAEENGPLRLLECPVFPRGLAPLALAAKVRFPPDVRIDHVRFMLPADIVATAMGGMGRQFDGGDTEYTLVPGAQVQRITARLAWSVLGALPEMVQTAWSSLNTALRAKSGETLLMRGGTTSVRLTAAILAKQSGLRVLATSRREDRSAMLLKNGADEVFVDGGEIAHAVRDMHPDGVNKVLELVGTTTLLDSLQCAAMGGSVCMTGMAGNAREFERFSPMGAIPTAVNITTYASGAEDSISTPLQQVVDAVEAGTFTPLSEGHFRSVRSRRQTGPWRSTPSAARSWSRRKEKSGHRVVGNEGQQGPALQIFTLRRCCKMDQRPVW